MNVPRLKPENRLAGAIPGSLWRLVLFLVLGCPAWAHLELDDHIEIVSELIAKEPTAALYLRPARIDGPVAPSRPARAWLPTTRPTPAGGEPLDHV